MKMLIAFRCCTSLSLKIGHNRKEEVVENQERKDRRRVNCIPFVATGLSSNTCERAKAYVKRKG